MSVDYCINSLSHTIYSIGMQIEDLYEDLTDHLNLHTNLQFVYLYVKVNKICLNYYSLNQDKILEEIGSMAKWETGMDS
jgi:hypothetical protein